MKWGKQAQDGLVWKFFADPAAWELVPGCLAPGPGVIRAGGQWLECDSP